MRSVTSSQIISVVSFVLLSFVCEFCLVEISCEFSVVSCECVL